MGSGSPLSIELHQPFVRRVAGRVDGAGDEQAVARVQALDHLVGERRSDRARPSEHRLFVSGRMALDVDGHRHAGDMGGQFLHEDVDDG